MTNYSKYLETTHYLKNEHFKLEDYKHQSILSLKAFKKAKKEITSWDNYKVTPLHSLSNLAKEINVKNIYYKDESHRFGLKSFKALGGAYAVANLLIEKLKEKKITATSKDLITKKYYSLTKDITVCCATDGNHGKSVAWGASLFGCKCQIFIHSHVSDNRKEEIEKYGAIVNRIKGNYDDSIRVTSDVAKEHGFFIVSDTSYKGYTSVPKDVMQGYTVMVDEVIKQMKYKATHIFLQGGVGGMAAAVISFFHETYGQESPKFIIVEPNNADCLLQSAKNNKPTVVHGDLETVMAGLSCGEVSLLAWDIIKNSVSAFLSISDETIGLTMKLLANNSEPIIAGESAVAGLAVFLISINDEKIKNELDINEESTILFFSTEGDTDEEIYKELIR